VKGFKLEQDKGYAFGGFIFANFTRPGDHRIKIGPDGIVKVLLMDNVMVNLAASNYRDMRRGGTMSEVLPPEKGNTGVPMGILVNGETIFAPDDDLVTLDGEMGGEASQGGKNPQKPRHSTGCNKI